MNENPPTAGTLTSAADERREIAREIVRKQRRQRENETARLHEIEAAALDFYIYLESTIGTPNDPKALVLISGNEVACYGLSERLKKLGHALGRINPA